VISLVFIALNAYLFIRLSPSLGIRGLTIATAISAWLQLAALLFWMHRSEGLELFPILFHSVRVWLAAGVAVISASFLVSWLFVPEQTWTRWLLELALGGMISLILYALLSLLLRLPELGQLRKKL
jgi:peptidoglycan biosynthesis protein MviN/MurJ (putative lipid II flippase)